MSITETFDPVSPEIIPPGAVIRPVEDFPETVLTCFSYGFYQKILEMAEAEEIDAFMGGRLIPIFRLGYKGKTLGFYHSLLGGAASAALLEEAIAKGAKRILFFGSCGALDREVTAGKLIIPTAAWRDEGVSYHYAPAGDEIPVKTAPRLAEIFNDLGLPYLLTKTWTTDAFYRETERNVALRRAAGCTVVEMECASVMAVGQFRKVPVYQFLYAADCLDAGTWDRRILGDMPTDLRTRIATVALETASRL